MSHKILDRIEIKNSLEKIMSSDPRSLSAWSKIIKVSQPTLHVFMLDCNSPHLKTVSKIKYFIDNYSKELANESEIK